VGDWADPPIADPVESPHDPRPWQQLGAGQPGAALLVDPLHQRAVSVGYHIHVSKPVEPDRLVEAIAQVVARPR